MSEDTGSYLRSPKTTFTFIAHKGFQAQILAYMLDSLVRVSRRVNENHFVRISNAACRSSFPVDDFEDSTTLLSKPSDHQGSGSASHAGRVVDCPSIQSMIALPH